MNAKLSHIFKEMNQVEPSEKLGDLIIQRIGLEREKQARKKLFLSYAGLAASLLAIFPAILQFGIAFFHSEFWSIFTLAFSDTYLSSGGFNRKPEWPTVLSYQYDEPKMLFDVTNNTHTAINQLKGIK